MLYFKNQGAAFACIDPSYIIRHKAGFHRKVTLWKKSLPAFMKSRKKTAL